MLERCAQILIIDPDSNTRALHRELLAAEGMAVFAPEDPARALELLRSSQKFDAVLTELALPRMHGIDFVRELRHLDTCVPVIIITGHASLRSAIDALNCGGFRYIRKPVAAGELVQTVRDAVTAHHQSILARRALEL